MKRYLPVLAISLAVIFAATAAIVFSLKRAETARLEAERAASAEAEADSVRRTASAEAQAAADKRREAELLEKAKSDELAAAKLAKERAVIDERTAAENRRAAEAEAQRAADDAEAARANHEAKRLVAQTTKDERAKAEAEAKTAASNAEAKKSVEETERLRSERLIAEAKIIEDRQRDYESAHQRLVEWNRELEEREAALRPDKTIADLAWAGGEEDKIVDEHGNLKTLEKVPYDPETDPKLTPAARQLAKARRLLREDSAANLDAQREKNRAALTKLYEKALEEGHVIEAKYYEKCIKDLK